MLNYSLRLLWFIALGMIYSADEQANHSVFPHISVLFLCFCQLQFQDDQEAS